MQAVQGASEPLPYLQCSELPCTPHFSLSCLVFKLPPFADGDRPFAGVPQLTLPIVQQGQGISCSSSHHCL